MTKQEAVTIPFLQSFITGIFTMAIVTAFCFLVKIGSLWAWGAGALVGGIVALRFWFYLIDRIYRAVLEEKEMEEENEISREFPFHVEAIVEGGEEGFYFVLPGGQNRFVQVCKVVKENDYEFSGAVLWNRPDAPMGRSDYEGLRTQMVRAGLLTWAGRGHHRGIVLTLAGRGMVKKYADYPVKADTHTDTQGN